MKVRNATLSYPAAIRLRRHRHRPRLARGGCHAGAKSSKPRPPRNLWRCRRDPDACWAPTTPRYDVLDPVERADTLPPREPARVAARRVVGAHAALGAKGSRMALRAD